MVLTFYHSHAERFEARKSGEEQLRAPRERANLDDLIKPLAGDTAFGSLRKEMDTLKKSEAALAAPMDRGDRDRIQRETVYDQANAEVSKWVSGERASPG
jgi:U3 small nucleolar RNA-associated protein 14